MSNKKFKQEINVDLRMLEDVVCPMCGGKYFEMVHRIKKVPPMLSVTGKTEFISVNLSQCVSCGHVMDPLEEKEKEDMRVT